VYVVQNYDPFSATDSNGIALQSTSTTDRYIGYYSTYKNSLRIGTSPNHPTSSPANTTGRNTPNIFEFQTDNTNYKFLSTGWLLSQ
jgi:hypothetical protein